MTDNLTIDDLLRARDIVFPPLYYATSEEIERDKILAVKETSTHPEYIVFHPDNLEDIRKSITGRRLVHLRDLGPGVE
jgi:hypothetical protein